MKQNIVITMAGRGSRFYDAGYKVPKYEIVAHGHSLFYWSMLSLQNFLSSESKLIFVCLAENDSSDYIKSQCAALDVNDIHILELDQITDGQATSAYLTKDLWLKDAPLLIYNIDTYVEPENLLPEMIRPGSVGWIPCFEVSGDHWSFVKLNGENWACEVTEKQRISDYASIGLYWFSNSMDYAAAYTNFFSNPDNLVKGERYVAPLYRQYIAEGKRISISNIPESAVHVLGTPKELELFIKKPVASNR